MSLIKTLLKEIQSEDMTTLYHYSEVDDVEIELDPQFFGKHDFTMSDRKTAYTKRLFFYLKPTEKESYFDEYNLYFANVPTKDIYILFKDGNIIDKSKFIDKMKSENHNVFNFEKLFDIILSNGYKGIYYTTHQEVVIWFNKIKVKRYESN